MKAINYDKLRMWGTYYGMHGGLLFEAPWLMNIMVDLSGDEPRVFMRGEDEDRPEPAQTDGDPVCQDGAARTADVFFGGREDMEDGHSQDPDRQPGHAEGH